MKNLKPKDSAIEHVSAYIGERLAGANKQESALTAGYSETTARKPSLIEETKAYAIVVTRVLNTNSHTLNETMQELRQVVETKPVDWQKAYLIAQVADKMAKIHDTLTPKITVKETKDANGNITRTSWGTGSLQSSEN